LVPLVDEVAEGLDRGAVVAAQLHPHERLQAEPKPLRIDLGAIAGNHPVALQPLHPAQARRRRQIDPFGQLRIGLAAGALQLGEQQKIGAVERDSGHWMRLVSISRNYRARTPAFQTTTQHNCSGSPLEWKVTVLIAPAIRRTTPWNRPTASNRS